MPARFIFSDRRSRIAFWNAHASIGLFALLPRSGQFLRRAGFSTRPAAELHETTGLDASRLRLCFAGAGALEGVRRAFALDGLDVSTAGLREGLALEAVR